MQLKSITSLSLLSLLLILFGCNDDDPIIEMPSMPTGYVDTTVMVNLGAYELEVETKGEGPTTIVFENGLGDDFEVWKEGVYDGLAEDIQLIIYNRAGYGSSTPVIDSMPRDIEALARDLSQVITQASQNGKVILVGHSFGGPIIRSYVNLFPDKVEALLFVDVTHEGEYDKVSIKEFLANALENEIPDIPELAHVRREVEAMYSSWLRMNRLPALPDIPVTALTAMSLIDDSEIITPEERQMWYDLHASLGDGVTDFTHLSSDEVGHHIQIDDPAMVIDAILNLIN